MLKKFNLQPKIRQSTSVSILKEFISGVGIITPDIPPNFGNFASTSPKLLETDNLPGKTRLGPTITWLEPIVFKSILKLFCNAAKFIFCVGV